MHREHCSLVCLEVAWPELAEIVVGVFNCEKETEDACGCHSRARVR